jgi:hypothetical protein
MKDTSNFPTFQFSLQVTIENQILDYLVKVDDIGQVHEATPMIFELPIVTQKLILGETDEQFERKIKAYAGLLKYLVPLVLAGQLPAYQEQLHPLVEEIKQRLQNRALQWGELPLKSLPFSLVREVIEVYQRGTASPALKACWEKLVYIIENQNGWTQDEVRFLGYHHAILAADFFPVIIPFFKPNFQGEFYTNLRNVQSEELKNYLLKELNEPFSKPYGHNIVYCLAKYDPADLSIYEAVLNFYKRIETDLGANSGLWAFLSFLKHYPFPPTKEICFDILLLNQWESSVEAAGILLTMGVKQEEIVALLMPDFQSGNPDLSRVAFAIFAKHIAGEYLPNADKVLDIYVNELINNEVSYSVHEMPAIAAKTGIHHTSNRLYEFLEHENKNVRFGILAIINGYFDINISRVRNFLTPQMLDRYWDLTADPEEFVARTAIALIGKIGFWKRRADYIDYLLDIGRNTNSRYIKIETMKAIYAIMHWIPYPRQVEPFYLEVLENSDSSEWGYALLGLWFSPNRALKKALWNKYKDHTDSYVRHTAAYLLKRPHRGLRLVMYNIKELIKDWLAKTPE